MSNALNLCPRRGNLLHVCAGDVWSRTGALAMFAVQQVPEWSGPSLTVERSGPSALPQLLVNGADPQPPLWLVLHMHYSNMTVLDEQVRWAVAGGQLVHLTASADQQLNCTCLR